MKYLLTIDKSGIVQKHKPFKEFIDSNQFLDRSQYFEMIEGENHLFSCLKAGKNCLIAEELNLGK